MANVERPDEVTLVGPEKPSILLGIDGQENTPQTPASSTPDDDLLAKVMEVFEAADIVELAENVELVEKDHQPRQASYQTTPISRRRRTKQDIITLRKQLAAIVGADAPMTVRQAFYQATVHGLVPKDENAYTNVVARLLLQMRREGQIPYRHIADNTRWMRKPTSYGGLADFIERHQKTYRRDLWADSEAYVEIWLEKEALAGVLYAITGEYDVPLMVSRGFASESYLYEAADAITDALSEGKRAFIYYFGDFDPSGMKISASIEVGLRRLCPPMMDGWDDEWLSFRRVGVTEEQIALWNLPTRPTKTKGNRHANDWPNGRPSVELDAIKPATLKRLCREVIEQHVYAEDLERLRKIEAEERQQLAMFGKSVTTGGAP